MKYLKSLLSLLSFYYFVQTINASNETIWHSANDWSLGETLKSANELLKLRLEIIDLNMAKQNQSFLEINRKLQKLEDNFVQLFEILRQQPKSTKTIESQSNEFVTDPKGIESNEDVTMHPVVVGNFENSTTVQKSIKSMFSHVKSHQSPKGTESCFMTDISEKDEPKMCKLNADQKLICSDLLLSTSCADSNSLNCLNNKCRVKNHIYGPKSFWVGCDGDWTVIQRRLNGSVNFYRSWNDYKRGFGDLDGEFWIGLDKLHSLTSLSGPVELHIQLQDFDNVWKFGHYDSFSIGNESEKYTMRNSGSNSGDAGESFGIHSGEKFSTYDQDNDKNSTINCASLRQGAWWYYKCNSGYYFSNLNGRYYNMGVVPGDKPGSGIFWKTFHGDSYSMKFVQMMIRAKTN